jgi:hypothetical protein
VSFDTSNALQQIGKRPVIAQAQTTTIRPSTSTNVVSFTNPAYAYDGSPDDITLDTTSSYASLSRRCSSDCMVATAATATWSGFPSGYHPISLKARWKADASVSLFGGDTSFVEAKLEYSLDGGTNWSSAWDGESADYVWTGNSSTCPNRPW